MARDTIDRAITRGTGGGEGTNPDELVYEGYGSAGVAILVEAMTDNKNRTVAEVRHAFNKYNGNMGTDGSVAYLFKRRGVISYAPGADEEQLMEAALEAGAEDLEMEEDGAATVLTTFESFGKVVDALREAELAPDNAEVTMLPDTTIECSEDDALKVLRLIEALEELDDVQNVYSNGEFPESALEAS